MTKRIKGFGGGGGKGGGGGSSRVAVESPDSLRSKAFARVLDLICEGEIVGLVDGAKSIYLDETPLQNADDSYNFQGLDIVTRTGSQWQEHIPGFPAVENEQVVGVEVKKSASVTRQISNPEIDAVRVRISIPQLTSQNMSNGDINGTTVQYGIELQSNGGGFFPVLLSRDTFRLTNTSGIWSSASSISSATLEIEVYTPSSITFTVQRRPRGSTGAWTTLQTNIYSAQSGDDVYGNPWYQENFDHTFKENVTEGTYEYRVNQTAGSGTATITSATGYGGVGYDTVKGKTTSKYERSYRVDLIGDAPWDIRVYRVTNDSTASALQNKTFWESYTEIVDAKLRYPNSALVGIKIDSSQFNSIPTRAYDMKLLKVKVPTNYNPVTRAYTGIWDGNFKVEWTDNPAWCFYDLLTNDRYGLGGLLNEDQIDKWALYTSARYCDELVPNGFGGTEPRFTCNMYIQSRNDAFRVMQDMASIFRGMIYWQAGAVTVAQDAPSDPVYLYTPSNVIDGSFNYQGSSAKTRHSVALVSWNDPEDFYRQKVEYVEDATAIARYGIVQTDVAAIGCTSRGQANRVGRWLLYSEQSEGEIVAFKTGLEGAVCRPGQIIAIADPVRGGTRRGGRVVAATVSTITLDAAVTLPAVGNTISVMLPNGTVETRTVASVAGSNILTAFPLSQAPAPGAIWIVESPTLQSQLFRVVSVIEAEDGIEINALAHNPGKFDAIENGMVLQPRAISILDEAPAAPASATATETLYTYNDEIRVRVDLGWEKVQQVKYYVVQSQKDNGTVSRVDVYDSDFELLNVTPGVFTFRVYSVGVTGKLSTSYAETIITVLGKTAPPADVTGLTHVLDPNLGVTLTWNRVADLDLDAYEVRQGSTWAASTLVGQVKGTTLKVGLLTSGTTTYLIKALDTSGNYSTNAVSTAVTIVTAAAPVVASSFVGQNIVLTWGAVQGSLATDSYEIRYGASFAAGISLGTIKGTTFSAKANWSGSRTFWVAAIDLNGNTGTGGSVNAVVTIPSAVSITQEVIDNNVLLKWGDATQTLPVDYYELRKGATFAGATVIGRISARFTAIFEASGGTYNYWIAGVDIAGNLGAAASVTAFVNQPPDYQLQYDQNTVFAGTKSSMVANSEGSLEFVLPVDTTKTWETHFTSKSWTTPQAQITAGFPYYAQPTAASGFYEETIDYGTVLAATKITVTPTFTVLANSPVVQVTISVRKLLTDPWTDYANTTSVFVTDFRYVKFRITATSTGENDLIVLSGVNVRFDVKLKNDAGTASAVSTDSGGTQVNFNLPFVDVSSITVTPLSTSAIIAVYDFVDVPNPTGFKVLLFNTSGTRVSGTVSWSAKGV